MGERGGEQKRINFEVIHVANEWGVMGSSGEQIFFSSQLFSVNGDVILNNS